MGEHHCFMEPAPDRPWFVRDTDDGETWWFMTRQDRDAYLAECRSHYRRTGELQCLAQLQAGRLDVIGEQALSHPDQPATDLPIQAVEHLLERLKKEGKLGYYLCPLTQSWQLLTEAYARWHGLPVSEVRTRLKADMPVTPRDPERRELLRLAQDACDQFGGLELGDMALVPAAVTDAMNALNTEVDRLIDEARHG